MDADIRPIQRVAVPAISFAQVPELVEKLRRLYPDSKVNTQCIPRHLCVEDTIEYLRGCDAAIVSFEPINDEVLSNLPQLKVVSKLGVGLDRIDPVAMKKHGVRLGWTPGVNKRSVAELTLCLTLAALKHVVSANVDMRAGKRPLQRVGRELSGRVVGVHGCGQIGQEFIRLIQPFQCKVLACDLQDRTEFFEQYSVQPVSPNELYARSEVLSIHMNVTSRNQGLYCSETLNQLRHDCVLINTSRGALVDEIALRQILKAKKIAAAAFDVFEREPPEDDELLNLPNFIATPHIGSGSLEARLEMGNAAIRGLKCHFLPEPGQYPFEDP